MIKNWKILTGHMVLWMQIRD